MYCDGVQEGREQGRVGRPNEGNRGMYPDVEALGWLLACAMVVGTVGLDTGVDPEFDMSSDVGECADSSASYSVPPASLFADSCTRHPFSFEFSPLHSRLVT